MRYQLRYFSLVEKVGLEPTTSRLEGEIFFAVSILKMVEAVRFELTGRLHDRQFSRLLQ